jgi:dTDP-4-dehydrorhamnose reductase
MTRVLILGGNGMLGHKLWQVFSQRFDTHVTLRGSHRTYERFGIFDEMRIPGSVEALCPDTLTPIFTRVRPDVVVNAIGIVKQSTAAAKPVPSLAVNALFPHRLFELCTLTNSRLIHISTDCVFSGRGHLYREDDVPDADDLYGRSKLLGEVTAHGALTIRTSIIGRELVFRRGLIEWFLSQRGGVIQGYPLAVFSGLTTAYLARTLTDVVEHYPQLTGLYHVAADPISKYDLLCRLRDAFAVDLHIEPDEKVKVDRSLDATRFCAATGFSPPDWSAMIDDMVADPTPYEELRRKDGP